MTAYIPYVRPPHYYMCTYCTLCTCTHTSSQLKWLQEKIFSFHTSSVQHQECIIQEYSTFQETHLASYMHARALASLKTWNPKESAGRETVSLAFCSTGSSSGRSIIYGPTTPIHYGCGRAGSLDIVPFPDHIFRAC